MAAGGELDGWIADFWEQGMEEEPWLIFQDRAFTRGESWEREGMHVLAPGGRLTIFEEDGAVRWSGVLRVRRLGLFGRFGRRTLAPPGIDDAAWRAWFRRRPALRARYRPPPPRPR
ncbi:MAG: hypothetical protein H6711_17975 [Myxococcales bacterium]|nr:hypothetical protein [Myxococcales bacterium]